MHTLTLENAPFSSLKKRRGTESGLFSFKEKKSGGWDVQAGKEGKSVLRSALLIQIFL